MSEGKRGLESPRPTVISGARIPRFDPGPGTSAPFEELEVEIRDGRIARVGRQGEGARGESRFDARGLWLLPGWIDLQVNDFEGLGRGISSPEVHEARIREVARAQARAGVTGFCLATLAAPLPEVVDYLEGMRRVLEDPKCAEDEVLLGGLVEGSFLNPECCGAHNPHWASPATCRALDLLLATRAVRIVLIAPEYGEEALEVVRRAARGGVVPAVGHAKPNARVVREAVHAGLRYVIHLGNGPTGSSLKAAEDGGLLEEALRNDALTVGIILDREHIHPEIARDWIERKGVERVIAVSDAAFGAGVPPGEFSVLGKRGRPSPDGRRLEVLAPPGAPPRNPRTSDFSPLFGSAARMRDIFESAVNLLERDMPGVHHRRHRGLGLEGALAASVAFASGNPACLLGLRDRGVVEVGGRADLTLVEVSGPMGDRRIAVRGVWLGGRSLEVST